MTGGRLFRVVLAGGILMAALPAGFARATDPNDLKTDMDKVSYIVGTQIAAQILNSLKMQSVEVNMDMFIRGLQDALTGKKSPFSAEEQARIIAPWQKEHAAKMKARQEELRAKQEAEDMEKLGPENAWKVHLTKPELMKFDATKDYFWILETNKGNIRIKLMPDVAPMHVTSTIFLTNKGFYDGTTFHRVVTDFMAQGGDPLGNGRGGPGYTYDGEFSPNVKFDRPFLLAMANAGPGTDGSQFFITFKPTPELNDRHTIFGEVVEGQDTVKKLEAAGTPTREGRTKEPLIIKKARIEEKAKG